MIGITLAAAVAKETKKKNTASFVSLDNKHLVNTDGVPGTAGR